MPDQTGSAHLPALTVGELIRSAERESEQLLATAGPADATSLARGWVDVLAAAYEVQASYPRSR